LCPKCLLFLGVPPTMYDHLNVERVVDAADGSPKEDINSVI
jgi:hypothetical protein